MQSDVPPLPIACLTANLRLPRTSNRQAKQTAVRGSKSTSTFRNKKYSLKPHSQTNKSGAAVGATSPYKNNARLNPSDTANKPQDRSAISQRVSSAKMLRIKQLQNQLADAHFHLNELSNENKLLKAIQKRQDAALKRYEGTNAELPRIINTHHEDLRVLQSKYKKLKSQCSSLNDTLKERDNELHSLQAQNKKLLQLSKDRHLAERDKLQAQVFDLTHRLDEQSVTVQTLKRKLELETKYLKHQLHAEMVKHKETQKELEQAQTKLQQLERLSEQRLKRSYQASQLTYYGRARASVTSQSLTNLSDTRSENPFKLCRKLESESTTNQSLPSLNGAPSTPIRSQDIAKRSSSDAHRAMSERLASLKSAQHFTLSKSPASHRPAPPSTPRSTTADSLIAESATDASSDKTKRTYELPKSLKRELDYSTGDETSIKDSRSNSNDSLNDNFNYAGRSRSLHARLVNSASDVVRTNKTAISSRSRSLTKENLENILENEREVKYDRDSVITVISKDALVKDDNEANTNDSNSDAESEMEISLACAVDEDNNGQRKSDVIIEDIQVQKQPNTSSHLSSLFTHLRKPPNYSFNSKSEEKADPNANKINEKGTNVFKMSTNQIVDITGEVAIHDRSITKNIPQTSWNDDNLLGKDEQDSHENVRSLNDQMTRDQEDDIASSAEKLIDDITENLKKTKRLENNTIDTPSEVNQNKTSHVISKKMDFKDAAECKTKVNENGNKSFDKAKLLAAMKAIDDNDNVEFIDQKPRKNSASNRLRITENLYRGLPTHKKKSELMKELFSNANLDNNKDRN
ncbi:paramyosin isoform X2 [Phymastichus coffea]|uniref:paramyosin isoform X2 n=1 Tax=Phymastichus coffea TaxID=108790 RepID=UPI00273B1D37|nr:paramyosin isoform X2 [Phymastichus coffea]